MPISTMRTVLAGFSGGMAMNLAMLLTFRAIGFGWKGDGILLTSSIQSPKLIAVWTSLEPLPLVVTNPAPIAIGLVFFSIGHAFIYKWISVTWPHGVFARGIRLTGLVFFMSYLFWEFFTPINKYGEPLLLVSLELLFWGIIAAAEGFAVVFVMETNMSRPSAIHRRL